MSNRPEKASVRCFNIGQIIKSTQSTSAAVRKTNDITPIDTVVGLRGLGDPLANWLVIRPMA